MRWGKKMKRHDTCESWWERSKQHHRNWWSRKRSKGEFHFVWTTTLWSALLLFTPAALVEYFVDRDLRLEGWIFRIPFSLLGGLIISLVSWWANEAKHKNARIDARIESTQK